LSLYTFIVDINDLFSANLARIRKQRGYSQRQLAELTSISFRMICHYETKATAVPMNKLKAIADALNARIADFFEEDEVTSLDDIDVRWIKKIKEIQSLPESDRKEINQHINSLLVKSKLKKEQINTKS
jgi:transcriptional regulator with XRE-family HTH domain